MEQNGNGDKIRIHERLARLEEQMNSILTNHLPHVQKDVDRISRLLAWQVGLLITTLVSVVVHGIITSLLL